MDLHNLNRFFNPQRIALIGVTINPNSVGGRVLSNLVTGGFRGVVYPVNPAHEAVLGIQCYPDLASLPRTPDLAVIVAPAEQAPELVRQCGAAGILGIIILSAGFKEAGEAGKALEEQVKSVQAQYPGMRIIGPNCLGLIVPGARLNISFAAAMPKAGQVAFISQSGALCTSVLDWAAESNIGFSNFVSIGNTLDVDFGDLIDYFGEDEQTRSIILYMESVSQARQFMTAARAFARNKPIIVYKAGRFAESAQVAASHTGALAAEDAVYDAAFQRAGLVRVFDIGGIFDCVALLGHGKAPRGVNLGIVTNAGGPGVMAADALIAAHGRLAQLAPASLAALNETLPPMWSHGNPVDVLGDARPKRIARAAEIVLNDQGVDAVLVILTPQAMTNPTATAREISELAKTTAKPVLAAWLGGATMREGMRILAEAGVPAYQTPDQAVGAFMTLVAYARNLETLYETPRNIPVEFNLPRAEVQADFRRRFGAGRQMLPEDASKALLAAYGIPVTQPQFAADAAAAVKIAEQIGYPVVLKVHSPDISHKSDVGGVVLNLHSAAAVKAAFEQIHANAARLAPTARLEGVTVQRMIPSGDGVEMILGIKRDPVFGSVLLAGMGGIYAELFGDRALGFPPLNERLARRMLEELKMHPLLTGYRGKPPVNMDRLIEVIIRLSYLAADYPEIAELDINPLLVTPEAAIALDARIGIEPAHTAAGGDRYAHLALHPYPEEYVTPVTLADGTPVLLRPIKPEDEPLWLEMLGNCSQESIYSRFRYAFHWQSHDVATRYCYIDYDREIAIVAELNENGRRSLLGVGRLIADPDHQAVEYAVLVIDAWQQKELGSLLTDTCMEIARRWRLKRIVAQTTTDNARMIAVFRRRGFQIDIDPATSEVNVVKEIEE